jgi:transposase
MSKTPIAVLGIDLGKNGCSVAGLDATGAVVYRRRMTRDSIVAFTASLPSCTVALEACCGAHCLGRRLAAQGHTVRLMSPEYVQPYVKAQKTDDRDAEAIAEAATRPTMRFVPLKSEAQLDLQVVHRMRERLVRARTVLINQFRALLLERGVVLPKGRRQLMRRFDSLGKDELAVSPRIVRLLKDLREEWAALDRQLEAYDVELLDLTRSNEQARRLATIPGVGAINATALLAAVGDGSAFPKARNLAAWLGLTPRQHSTGSKNQNARDQQTGKPLFAQAADPRSARRHAPPRRQANANGSVVKGSAGTIAPKRRGRGAGRQVGSDRLGRLRQQTRFEQPACVS